jgi:hypothetical protein
MCITLVTLDDARQFRNTHSMTRNVIFAIQTRKYKISPLHYTYIQCTSKDFNVSIVYRGNRLDVSRCKVQIEVGLHEGNKKCKFHSIRDMDLHSYVC